MSLKDWITSLGSGMGAAALVWNFWKELKKRPRFTATVEWYPEMVRDPGEVVRLRYFNARENDVQVVSLWYERRRLFRKPEFFYPEEDDHPGYRMKMVKVPKHDFADLDREVVGRGAPGIFFPPGIKVRAVVELASGERVRSNRFQRLPPLAPWEKVGTENGQIHWRRTDGSEQYWESDKPTENYDIRKVLTRNRPP